MVILRLEALRAKIKEHQKHMEDLNKNMYVSLIKLDSTHIDPERKS